MKCSACYKIGTLDSKLDALAKDSPYVESWDAKFCSEGCRDQYFNPALDHYYELCKKCRTYIFITDNASGKVWFHHVRGTMMCEKCYHGEILENGQQKSDFEGDRPTLPEISVDLMELKEHGFQFSSQHHITGDTFVSDTALFNGHAKRLLNDGAKVVVVPGPVLDDCCYASLYSKAPGWKPAEPEDISRPEPTTSWHDQGTKRGRVPDDEGHHVYSPACQVVTTNATRKNKASKIDKVREKDPHKGGR